MEYFLIKGHFHVLGYSPDGDSLVFEANNPKHWDKVLTQHRDLFDKKLKAGKGSVQLRLQGIDALETHYSVSTTIRGKKGIANYKQPKTYGTLATDKLLEQLGVEETKWRSGKYINGLTVKKGKKSISYSYKNKKDKNTDKLEGYIIVNDVDRKGRPISWVYGGKTSTKDGSKLSQSKVAARIKRSANYKLVATGMVYPYFFMTLAAALRRKIIDGYQNAQRQKMGIWSEDKTQVGIPLKSTEQLTDKYILFPYLFRRILKIMALRQSQGVKGKATDLYLDTFFDDTNPYVFLIKEKDFVRLDSIVNISKTKFKLSTHPGNIVFLS